MIEAHKSVMETVTTEQIEALARKIFNERGFDLSVYTTNYVQRRVNACLMRANCAFQDYLRLLDSDPEEYSRFFDTLTINVTEFFRDPPVWKVLEETFLPQIINEKLGNLEIKRLGEPDRPIVRSPDRTVSLRIWSAGCASGEEPYSIAIMLKEAIEKLKLGDSEIKRLVSPDNSISQSPNFLITIFATDIDDASLEKARRGIYSKEALKNVSPQLLQKYFTLEQRLGDSDIRRLGNTQLPHHLIAQSPNYKISAEIKNMVLFKKHHFFNDRPFTYLDIVFCRNATIYLKPEMKDHLLNVFYKSLNFHGLLVTGKAETIFQKAKYNFYPVDAKEHIFRKERRVPAEKLSVSIEKRKNFWWGGGG